MGTAASHDVIVVGGGPAGSTAATLVARQGRKVLLLDREVFPRFRIGESLMPATYWTLERLGMLGAMKESHFPRKHSVQFFSKSGRSSVPFYFSDVDPSECSVTWQVDRAEFDHMLLDHAASQGVEVREGVKVEEVLFEGSRAVGVRAEIDGAMRELRSQVVVDATGQTAMLSRKLGLKVQDPLLLHVAVFTRYVGAWRGPGIDEGATLVLQSEHERTWFWYIPLPDDQVSVGVVGPIERLVGGGKRDPQAIYDEEVRYCPAVGERVRQGRQSTGIQVLRDFSYISKRIAGDGWVMVGDAFGFLDPIYSTGVLLGLNSAEFAADAIAEAFAKGDFSAEILGRHGERYVAGMEAMRKMAYAYYDPAFRFSTFLRMHPECRDEITHLLTGNVFRRPIDGLFEAMGELIELPEARALSPRTI